MRYFFLIIFITISYSAEIRFESTSGTILKEVYDEEIVSFFNMYNSGKLSSKHKVERKNSSVNVLGSMSCKLCHNPIDTISYDFQQLEFRCDGVIDNTNKVEYQLNSMGAEYSRYLVELIRFKHCSEGSECTSNRTPKPMIITLNDSGIPTNSKIPRIKYHSLTKRVKELRDINEQFIEIKLNKRNGIIELTQVSESIKHLKEDIFKALNHPLIKNILKEVFEMEKTSSIKIIKTEKFPIEKPHK